MYPSVKKVVPGENYVLVIDFDNGESGTLDMKPFLEFGIFKRLKDYSAFKQVRVAFDTVEWNSGIDLDPEFVYAKCQGLKRAQQDAAADRSGSLSPNGERARVRGR